MTEGFGNARSIRTGSHIIRRGLYRRIGISHGDTDSGIGKHFCIIVRIAKCQNIFCRYAGLF